MKKVYNIKGMLGKTAVFLALLLCAVGCLKDKISTGLHTRGIYEGTPMKFFFADPNFDPGTSLGNPVNRFGEYVEGLTLFVFDEQGILVKTVTVPEGNLNNAVSKHALAEGKYTIVAWGNNNSAGGLLASYSAMEADNSNNPANYIPAQEQGTTLNSFRMMLASNDLPIGAPSGLPGTVTPYISNFDDLYYSMLTDFEVDHEQIDTMRFNFKRNTHKLKIHITGLKNLDNVRQQMGLPVAPAPQAGQPPIKPFVIGMNDSYGYLNRVLSDSRNVRYEPMTLTNDDGLPVKNPWWDDNEMMADIKILRLEAFNILASPVILYLCDPLNNKPILYFNVIETLFNNEIFTDQEDLDRQYELNVDVRITAEGGMTVTINEWEIEDLTPIIYS